MCVVCVCVCVRVCVCVCVCVCAHLLGRLHLVVRQHLHLLEQTLEAVLDVRQHLQRAATGRTGRF